MSSRSLRLDDAKIVRPIYLSRHESARYWVDYEDFAFYRMEVADVYFVGGFGVMGWVTKRTTTSSRRPIRWPTPRPSIIEHMNKDHAESLLLLARFFAGGGSRTGPR